MNIKTLSDTSKMMISSDYKERFKAEYYQLRIRRERLGIFINDYYHDKLTFAPACDIGLLMSQAASMDAYLVLLKYRAKIEDIDLDESNN